VTQLGRDDGGPHVIGAVRGDQSFEEREAVLADPSYGVDGLFLGLHQSMIAW